MQRSITQQIKDRTLTSESLTRNASAKEYQAHHHEWLEAAVRTGDVKFVDMLVRLFPMIVADHPDGFPCSYAFEQHDLPMLEGLLKAGANTRAKYKGQDLVNFGVDLFLLKGSVWYSSKNWYRRCMKRLLALRPVTSADDETYNEIFKVVMREAYAQKPVPGSDKLLLRLLQAGVNPNVAKNYFGALIKNHKPAIIKLLRQYGADFNIKCKVKNSSSSGYRTYESLRDFACDVSYGCLDAIDESIISGKELYDRLDGEYRSSQFREKAVANKESIFAYVLRLPDQDKKMEALGKIARNDGPLGMIFWSKRGRFAPTATNGMRAVAGTALAYFTAEQERAAEKEKVAKAESEAQAVKSAAPLPSSTARLHATLSMSRTQPASLPTEMNTNTFDAAMAALPDVLTPVFPEVPKEDEKVQRVKLHS